MIEFRALCANEINAWYAHCQGVFVSERPDYFQKHYENDPDCDNSLIFVAVDDGVIVSTVRVFKRKCWIHGRAVAMGGIGEVSTKADYRRKGLAETLLRMSIDAMAAQSMPISMLLGAQPLYYRLGWRPVKSSVTSIHVDSLSPLPSGVDARPFEERALPALEGIYDLYAGRLNGALLRSPDYWRKWVITEWPARPAVLYADDMPAGYCCATKAKNAAGLAIHELCMAPQALGLIPGFLKAVAAEHGCDHLSTYSALVPGMAGVTSMVSKDMMVRLNIPWDTCLDSDTLAGNMMPNAGIFSADMF